MKSNKISFRVEGTITLHYGSFTKFIKYGSPEYKKAISYLESKYAALNNECQYFFIKDDELKKHLEINPNPALKVEMKDDIEESIQDVIRDLPKKLSVRSFIKPPKKVLKKLSEEDVNYEPDPEIEEIIKEASNKPVREMIEDMRKSIPEDVKFEMPLVEEKITVFETIVKKIHPIANSAPRAGTFNSIPKRLSGADVSVKSKNDVVYKEDGEVDFSKMTALNIVNFIERETGQKITIRLKDKQPIVTKARKILGYAKISS